MVHLTRVLICGVVVDLPVNRVVSPPIVHDAAVWDPGMVLVDMALAGTDTGLGIDPRRVKTLPLSPDYACVSILNAGPSSDLVSHRYLGG